jgi:hypothetical protein
MSISQVIAVIPSRRNIDPFSATASNILAPSTLGPIYLPSALRLRTEQQYRNDIILDK